MLTGWECPVCHKGNAPFALKCGHCASAVAIGDQPPAQSPETWLEQFTRRKPQRVEVPIQPLRIGDPPGASGPGVTYVGRTEA